MADPRPERVPPSPWNLRHVVGVALLAATATSLPYLWLWATTPDDQVYLGLKAVNSADHLTYVAWMVQAADGSCCFQNLYTPEPHEPVYCLPFFGALGWAAALTGVDPLLFRHFARALFGFVLVLTAWWFTGTYHRGGTRIRAFLLLALGTGLPALIPEASPVSAMFDSEVLAASWSLLLLALGLFQRGMQEQRAPILLASGVAAGILAVVHPYDAVTFSAVVAVATLGAGFPGSFFQRLGRASLAMLPFAAGAGFSAWQFLGSPLLREWTEVPRPFAWWSLLTFSVLWVGAAFAPRPLAPPRRFLVLWLATQLLLLVTPTPVSSRLIQGLQAPLAMLAAAGFEELIRKGWGRFARLTEVTVWPAAVIMLLLEPMGILPTPGRLPRPVMSDLRQLAGISDGVILADPALSYFIPPLSGRQVYAGNYGLTIRWSERQYDWGRFVNGKLTATEMGERGIELVVAERTLELEDRQLIPLKTMTTLKVWSVPHPRTEENR